MGIGGPSAIFQAGPHPYAIENFALVAKYPSGQILAQGTYMVVFRQRFANILYNSVIMHTIMIWSTSLVMIWGTSPGGSPKWLWSVIVVVYISTVICLTLVYLLSYIHISGAKKLITFASVIVFGLSITVVISGIIPPFTDDISRAVNNMFCRRRNSTRCRKAGSVPVYLNVYDLTSMNGCAYWLGLGVYHSGVQVHGVEYAFGSHEFASSGIFEGEPKECEGFTFRKQIPIGWTEMSLREVRGFMKELAQDYKGISYNLITRNCNHFCNDVCLRLTGNPIPSWINRLARFGLLCDCIIPASVSSCKIGIEDNNNYNERSSSSKFTSSSSSPSSSEQSTLASTPVQMTRSFGRKNFVPPTPLFLLDSFSSSS